MRRLLLALALLVPILVLAAVDSANKRGSVVNMTGSVLPVPNSGIDAGDRAQLVGVYRGFQDGAGGEVTNSRTKGVSFQGIGIGL